MPEENKKVTNPELVAALEQLHQENNPQNQNRALDILLNRATLLSPVQVNPIPGQEEAAPGEQKKANIRFQLISTQDGRPFLPGFTDEEELRKFIGDQKRAVMMVSFDHYVELLTRDENTQGLVVNPMGKSLTLERATVLNLAKRKKELAQAFSEEKMERDTQIMIGDPVQVPTQLVEAVTALAQQREDISALWLRQMVRPDGVQTYVIVVDHTGVQEEVFQAIAETARTCTTPLPVDMIPYGTDFAQAATEEATPFFTKE